MANPMSSQSLEAADRIARLEARVAELERIVGISENSLPSKNQMSPVGRAVAKTSEEEIELELGQNWFAPVGIIALAVGAGFMLTLPYPHLPAIVPSAAGLLIAGGIFATAYWGRDAFVLVSSYLRAAAMALQYCAILRLFYFCAAPALSAD